jgi:hypothetical protein
MSDFTDVATAAVFLGVSEGDPHLTRLVAVANQYVTDYLNRDDTDDLEGNAVVEQATLETVANLYRNRTTNPAIAAISLGDGSVSFRDLEASEPIPATATALLRPYRFFTLLSSV